jgi:hypothetical protein
MRILLIVSSFLFAFSADLSAQSSFKSLDARTYDYYLKGDLKNLEKTADTLFTRGIDYYYLRIRLAITAFNNQRYSIAVKHFKKAVEFNSTDTVSTEYIYNSYLFSGREADANLYLRLVPSEKRNRTLKLIGKPVLSEIFAGSSASFYNVPYYQLTDLNSMYEALQNSFSINAGLESYLSGKFKGTFAYTNFRKSGIVYSRPFPSGTNINFIQNQVYAKLAGYVFPGWEFSGFGHIVFYSDATTRIRSQPGISAKNTNFEYLGGLEISKIGWKIRTGANISLSNFSNSGQIRSETYLTWMPAGNLNLYITSGWMGQTDKLWGGTYQINQEIGFKISNSLWFETGIVAGNSFLYARNQGYIMNNSFLIPAKTIYGNIIILPGKHFSITLNPLYTENQNYSWDLNIYTRTGKVTHNSFGTLIKLIYKN